MKFLDKIRNATGATIVALFAFNSCQTPVEEQPEQIVVSEPGDTSMMALNLKIRQNPSDAELYHQRALALMTDKKMPEAFNDLRRAIKIDSLNPQYFMSMGEFYFQTAEGTKSLQAYQQASRLVPNEVEPYLKQAELHLYLQDITNSIKSADLALQIDKFNAKAYFIKGMAFKFGGDTTTALSSFQTAVEQDPEYYNAYIQMGLIHAARHEPVALQYLNNAIRVNPSNPEAHYAAAMFLQEAGDFEQAMEIYDNILKLDSVNRDAMYNKGYIYSEVMNSPVQAESIFLNLVETYPSDVKGWYMLGYSREKQNNMQGAKSAYGRALNLDPQFDLAAMGLSRISR